MADAEQPPARSQDLALAPVPPDEHEPAVPKNSNIPPPPPGLLPGVPTKQEGEPLLDPTKAGSVDPKAAAAAGTAPKGGPKKGNMFDDWKAKLLGTNRQGEKAKINQGLDDFNFTYKFQKKLFDEPMKQFHDYLLDEKAKDLEAPVKHVPTEPDQPALPAQGTQSATQDKPAGPVAPAPAQPAAASGDQGLGDSQPKLGNSPSTTPAQPQIAAPSQAVIEVTAKPAETQAADKVKLNRFLRRIDLNFQIKPEASYAAGVTSIVTSPDSRYAILNVDYGQVFTFVDLKQPGDRYLGKKQTYSLLNHYQWTQSKFNLHKSLNQVLADPDDVKQWVQDKEEASLKYVVEIDSEGEGKEHLRRSFVQFFPDSTKIAFLDSDRLQLSIYDVQAVAKQGWKGEDALIETINLLELKAVQRYGKQHDVFGVDKSDIKVPEYGARTKHFVPITFFYFEKIAVKGTTFSDIQQDVMMIGTCYGIIRIILPRTGFFFDEFWETKAQEEEDLEDLTDSARKKLELQKSRVPSPGRWFLFIEKYVQVYAPDHLFNLYDEFYLKSKPENVITFFNDSGTFGWVNKVDGFKTVIAMKLDWNHYDESLSKGKISKKKRNNKFLSAMKPAKLGMNSSVFPENPSPGDIGILSYDSKKAEITKITAKGNETAVKLGRRMNVKAVVAKDDNKLVLIIEENGKATLHMNLNKNHIQLDAFDMKLESFQGKKDEIIGISHYYGNVQILDDYSAVLFTNNSSLFIYDIDLPAPNKRYFMDTTDEENRPYAPIGPNWFLLRGEENLYRMEVDGNKAPSSNFVYTKIIDFDQKAVQVKALITSAERRPYSAMYALDAEFDKFVEKITKQESGQNNDNDGDSANKSEDGNNQAVEVSKQPQPRSDTKIVHRLLFSEGAVFPISEDYTTAKRSENSGKSLGNDSGLPLDHRSNHMSTQFVPGSSHLELYYWQGSRFGDGAVVGLHDYSTSKPLRRFGAFSPPTVKWELPVDSTRCGGSFKWDGKDIGSFFKFDPSGTVAAFSLKYGDFGYKKIVTIIEIASGKVLGTIPIEIFSQVTSTTTVMLAVQEYDKDEYSDSETSNYFKNVLKPNLLKYLMENRKRRPVMSYDLLTDQVTEIYSIKDYSQQPLVPDEQKPYMFFNSHLLPLDIPDMKKAAADSEAAAKAPTISLLLKPNLIALVRCNDTKFAKDPVGKIQKIWEDSSKKINFNAITKDGSVVFSPGNLWMAYYDESTLDVIRVMWTPTLEFAKFINLKGKEYDQLKVSSRGIRSLRLCFSDDNKYLVIKAGKKLTLYELSPPTLLPAKMLKGRNAPAVTRPGRATEISDLETSELVNTSNIVSMKFRQGLLDLAYVRDYTFFFESVSFDFNPKNLYLKSLRNRLLGFQLAPAGKEQLKVAAEIAAIMMEQPIHQKFNDSTYLKILCAFKRSAPLVEYLKLMVKSPHIIFQHNPYREIVEYTNGMGATNRVIESLIDFVENCVTKNNELPIYDTDVLLSWLREKKIENNGEPQYDKEGKEVVRSLEAIKISIQYKRKLLQLITLAPTQRTIIGELRSPENNVTSVICSYSDKERFPAAIEQAKKTLMDEHSANSITYNSFFSAFPFDLTNGSKFSLDYFTWLEDVSDEDLVNKYAGIIYYKWSLVLKPAVIYSLCFWILNAALCAFMGFSYKTVWLGAITIVLHCLFILYEFKCYLFAFIESIKDPWNYVDIVSHLFSLLSVGMLLHFRNRIDNDPKLFSQLSWLRMVSFSLITFRSLGLFRIFSGTRYLIVMIFAVFKEIAIFLSVFGYMIFIYWFVCLIRPSLVPGGADETFYNAITQSLDIAFSNFNGADLSWIVLVSTVMGQVILGLVLLNYLIAIVSKTHERVSEQRSLYDIRILLTIIKEFDSFFYVKKNNKETIDEKKASTYITVLAEQEQSIQVKKLKEGLRVLEAEQGSSKLMMDLDNVGNKVKRSLFELQKKIDTMGTQLDIEVRNVLKNRKLQQTKITKGLPDVVETCRDSIFNKVKQAKLSAQSKGEKSAQEKERLRIQELEAMIAAKEAEKKLKEASHEASRMLNNDSGDEDSHESMDQIDEDDEEDKEEGEGEEEEQLKDE